MSGIWSELTRNTQASNTSGCMLYPIEDQTALSVIGPDSHKFMQGQFTCHLDDITENTFRPGACCNAKGRMVSSFNLMQLADGQYLLSLHQSLSEITLNHLKKYRVFYKTQMQITDYASAGITGQQAETILADVFTRIPQSPFEQTVENGNLIIKLPHGAGFQLWLTMDSAKIILKALASKCTLSSNTLWNKNLIDHGLGYVSTNTSEAFIPQMMNFMQAGGVSLNKGCYTGQEIVARMQYLGKLKRHMYRIAINPDQPVAPSDELYINDKDSVIGHIVNAIIEDKQQVALAVMEDKHLPLINDGQIFVGANQANVTELLSLPYDVIDEQPA